MVTLDSGSRKGADSSKSKQSVFGRKEQQIQESKKQETYGQKHFQFPQKGSISVQNDTRMAQLGKVL
jgi:hypothetical protein